DPEDKFKRPRSYADTCAEPSSSSSSDSSFNLLTLLTELIHRGANLHIIKPIDEIDFTSSPPLDSDVYLVQWQLL
ncbi:hypothetical protein HK102_011546, partial [Quaeritorhiza haematococci]